MVLACSLGVSDSENAVSWEDQFELNVGGAYGWMSIKNVGHD